MYNDEVKTVLLGETATREIRGEYIHDLKLGISLLYDLDEKLAGYNGFVDVYNQIREETIKAKEEAIEKEGLPASLFQGLEIRLLEFEFKQILAEKSVEQQFRNMGGLRIN